MKIVALSREYGAGGHSVGQAVAKELGIEFYDKDIIRETAKKMGLDVDSVSNVEERITKGDSFLRAISPISYDFRQSVFDYERQVILELAKKGPCVILGRCVGEILKHQDVDYLNVYLYADAPHRAKRVGEILNTTDINVISKAMKKEDSARRAFFQYFAGQNVGTCSNWHMSLDTGVLGYEKCIKIICEAAQ